MDLKKRDRQTDTQTHRHIEKERVRDSHVQKDRGRDGEKEKMRRRGAEMVEKGK